MSDHIFDSVFIDFSIFAFGYEMLSAVFESGVLLFIVGMFTVTNDLKNDRKNRSVSYRSYRKGD